MKIKLLDENAKVPFRGSNMAAGYDLYSAEEAIIPAGDCRLISTGIALEIPNNYFGGIFPRSGTAVKRGLRLANCVGVIDADYRGEVKVPLYNDSSVPQKIELNERIAQLIILPFATVEYEVVDELSDTERGEGGFNSTGRK